MPNFLAIPTPTVLTTLLVSNLTVTLSPVIPVMIVLPALLAYQAHALTQELPVPQMLLVFTSHVLTASVSNVSPTLTVPLAKVASLTRVGTPTMVKQVLI